MSNRIKTMLKMARNNVNVTTDRKLLKPVVCRNLGDTFLLQTDNNNTNNLKNYLVEWVNKSDPSYGLSDNDYPSYDVNDVTNEKHNFEGNVTSCAYNNSKKETCITLNNINYTLEFSNDTQNYNQITVENNNFNDKDNVFNIIENAKQVNHDDNIYGKSSVILGTPVSSVENPTAMEQDNDDINDEPSVILGTSVSSLDSLIPMEQDNYDINGEPSVILGTSVSSLDSLIPMEQDNYDINGEPSVILGTSVSSLDSLIPMEQDNYDINGEPSVILGTAESLVGSLEVHLNTNNQNKRKSRVSLKGDTRQFRIYRNQKRNTGLEYTTNTGKTVKPRASKILLDCKAKCKSKIQDDLREQLFNMYWAMGSFNRRTSYMSKLITCCPKKSCRKRRDTPEKQKPKEKTYKYYVPRDGDLIQVCKGCFMRIFCESTKFLRNICTNMLNSPAQRCSPDKRGCAPPGNKRCQDIINLLINHINSLPSYESHYCRKETSKKYLPSHFTLQRAYEEYKISVEKPVSRTLYEKYFKAAGLKVKNPKKDTCAQCDKYKIKLTDNIITTDQKNKIIEDKIQHQNEAEQAYESKRNDIATMSTDHCVLSFDLQQCLPTPSLESSVAFYKRQLWTYNLTVHNCASSKATCYIWYETLAKRGANEIGSCVYNYLSNLPKNITHVTMYSDCCPGQNKNSILMAMCLFFLDQQETIETIDHKFMVPGHSRMECDSDHAKIEKARKTFPSSINHPYDWMQLIRFAGKNKFLVVEMVQEMFFDFNKLLKKSYQMKKTNENKEKFVFRDVKWIRYIKNEKGIVFYKTSLGLNAKFLKLNLNRKNATSMEIERAYYDMLCITEEKKKDLMTLLAFIPETFHDFYKSLKSNIDINDPIISDEENE